MAKYFRIISGSILLLLAIGGFGSILSGENHYPLSAGFLYIILLVCGLLLLGVRFKKLFKKSTYTNTAAKSNKNTGLPVSDKTIQVINDIKVERQNNRKFFESEFDEQPESRKWNSDPSFASVLTPYNNGQFETAIAEGKKLINNYSDFDILYSWIGGAYSELSMYEQSKNIFLEGLKKSRRKCGLLIDLAEVSWKLSVIDDTIYYLSQALCCSIRTEEYKIYLLLHYIAKGMLLENEAGSFLQRADNLRAGQIRLNANDSYKLVELAKNSANDASRKIIMGLNDKYLKNVYLTTTNIDNQPADFDSFNKITEPSEKPGTIGELFDSIMLGAHQKMNDEECRQLSIALVAICTSEFSSAEIRKALSHPILSVRSECETFINKILTEGTKNE